MHRHRWVRGYYDQASRCDYVGCDAIDADVLRILAIDPGTESSAWMHLEDGMPVDFGIVPNGALIGMLEDEWRYREGQAPSVVVIEQVASYGMPVGREVFETVRWSGRFEQACQPAAVVQLTRKAVVTHLCGSSRAKDANVRAALIDRYGGKAAAIGTKAEPGPLHGIAKDVWSALAIACVYADRKEAAA
jgi:hypothetical protein